MKAKDVSTMKDGLLLFEASTRVVLSMPEEMKFTVDEFRNRISQVAYWFRDHPEENTEDYYLLVSKYAKDYDKYAGHGAINIIGSKGNYRIFIVKEEIKHEK
ncbi:MAG: hypothetical protein JRN37_06550 [Nitrososphaerota archaeon]|jgi:hypothetical protein|nr:hypothetical protein [Nitrososphaerota archaeon]MDG7038796.1 hypothetical protein [Nitrososphaerota archaeon]